MSIAPYYCPERTLMADNAEEEALQQLIYEW